MKLSAHNILLKTVFVFGTVLPQWVAQATLSLDADGCLTGTGSGRDAIAFCADPANDITCCTDGYPACSWESTTVTRLCDGSCRFDSACHWIPGAAPEAIDIGPGGCNGPVSCKDSSGTIGEGSCKYHLACKDSIGSIGSNSCIGDRSCQDSIGPVGSNSCTGRDECRGAYEVGDNSCNNDFACTPYGDFTLDADGCLTGTGTGWEATNFCADPNNDITCCSGLNPCRWASTTVTRLCDGSCVGERSCDKRVGSINIGEGSCTEYHACKDSGAVVGDGSCQGDRACFESPGPIEPGTCNGSFACNGANEPSSDDQMGVTGDPHFKTKMGHDFDFHGSCDLVLVHVPEFAHGLGLNIHIRTKSRYQYSYIESAALKIGDDILEVGSWGESFFNGVDSTNENFPKTMGGLVIVTHKQENKKRQRFEIALDYQSKIVMRTFKDLVSVTMDKSCMALLKGSVGMLGGASGKMVARDGTTVMESDPNSFGNEWQVLDTEPMLFQNLDRFPQYPEACVMPGSTNAAMTSRRLGGGAMCPRKKLLQHARRKEGELTWMDVCTIFLLVVTWS